MLGYERVAFALGRLRNRKDEPGVGEGFSRWVFKNIHQREESGRRRKEFGRKMVRKEKMMATGRTMTTGKRGEGWRRRPNNFFFFKKNNNSNLINEGYFQFFLL